MKLTTVDTDAKTVVISEEELGEIKHTPKQITKAKQLLLRKKSMMIMTMMTRKMTTNPGKDPERKRNMELEED